MLKMQLPMKKAEEGDDAAEDEKEERPELLSESAFTTAEDRLQESTNVTEQPGFPSLSKEAVYEWFGLHLNSAKRLEFMYGLLHMFQPLELRFLGSCLEDLARKDFHVLRDFEIRANSSSDLGLLADITDPVTRSKMLVCLSLLGSENRECAGILFRILSHVDPALLASSYPHPPFDPCRPCRLSGDSEGDCNVTQSRVLEPVIEPRSAFLEQLAVLFTMASLHPAFLFHQRDKLRRQLEKLERTFLVDNYSQQNTHSQGRSREPKCLFASTEVCVNKKTQSQDLTPAHRIRRAERDGKTQAVHIEKIVLKGITWGKTDREYSFEVKWSDLSTSSVIKTHLELEYFLLKLPKEQSTDCFERGILRLLNQGQKHECREVERSLKEKFLSAPHAFCQKGKVCVFFHCGSSKSPNLSCSQCNHVSSGKPYKEDCSEASSQEEDMEPYVQGHRKKPGNKSPSLSMWGVEGKTMNHGSEKNGLSAWKKKSLGLKPTFSQNTKAGDEQGEKCNTKPKARAGIIESSENGGGRVSYITNGVRSQLPLTHHSKGKDTGPCQNRYGETSSESYSSPSSPQHDCRESLESEDEKGKDTDSHSDDSRKSDANSVLVCPETGGPIDALQAFVPLEQGCQSINLDGTLQSTAGEFPQLHFANHAPYSNHNGPDVLTTGSTQQVPENKVGTELMMPHPVVIPNQLFARDDPEKCQSEATSAIQSFNTSVLGLQPPGSPVVQPVLQRFKMPGAQSVTESGVLVPPAHQSPMGAINLVQSGTTYLPALQATYTCANQDLSSISPAESLTKPPGLTLPSALPPSFNLSSPTTGIPPMCTVGSVVPASSSQVPPPVVPTHTPGPAPSPIPALTHSTAQSDGNSYINSSARNIPQLPAAQQVLGCNACGCRGHSPSYYYPAQMNPRQVFNMPPIFQLPSMCSSSYLNQLSQTPQTNGATQMPFYPAAPGTFAGGTLLHPHSHTHSDHVLGSQATSFGLQQMTTFNRFYQPIYATVVPGAGSGPGMALGAVSGGFSKKTGNISCYNCGVSGHFAQDCKQPSLDSTQQGGFRLKYAPQTDALDNNPD